MAVRRYTDLIVWQLAEEFKRATTALVQRSPEARRHYKFIDQLETAASGPAKHVAEGFLRVRPARLLPLSRLRHFLSRRSRKLDPRRHRSPLFSRSRLRSRLSTSETRVEGRDQTESRSTKVRRRPQEAEEGEARAHHQQTRQREEGTRTRTRTHPRKVTHIRFRVPACLSVSALLSFAIDLRYRCPK